MSAQYVKLTAGDLSLKLAPALGGSVAAFRCETESGPFDLFRPMSVPLGEAPHALYSGMFPMVPFANCIRENRFELDGRAYTLQPNMDGVELNFHGSGWQLGWDLTDAGGNFAELTLETGDRDPVYRYTAVQRFALSPEALEVALSVTNNADQPMPFSFGLHPWFMRHGDGMVRFDATGRWLQSETDPAKELVALGDEDDYSAPRAMPRSFLNSCYEGWNGFVEINWPGAGVSLEMSADPLFDHLMTHVPHGQPDIFCLEPQTTRPCGFDGLEHNSPLPGVFILAPGETVGGGVRFAPRPL